MQDQLPTVLAVLVEVEGLLFSVTSDAMAMRPNWLTVKESKEHYALTLKMQD